MPCREQLTVDQHVEQQQLVAGCGRGQPPRTIGIGSGVAHPGSREEQLQARRAADELPQHLLGVVVRDRDRGRGQFFLLGGELQPGVLLDLPEQGGDGGHLDDARRLVAGPVIARAGHPGLVVVHCERHLIGSGAGELGLCGHQALCLGTSLVAVRQPAAERTDRDHRAAVPRVSDAAGGRGIGDVGGHATAAQ